ncbi:hypothetical protein [Amycolatopsis taiwanensis]|uniref:DUF5666 domain-containing protein n=1 Tax=Amycolatopsis taiwanensis TaxID=342230 RepID=A0A9W6R3H2_9PSEU|nr:hypothetical protein [Amycolatopsis taiwanensis]GLY68824.1 hypothetical protein Atai01_54430 [Amycolatopsis taiwanensis]
MSTEPTTTALPQAQPAWGDRQPPPPKWSGRKTAVGAAVAVAIIAVGGVAIYAGRSWSNSQQNAPGGPVRMGGSPMGESPIMPDALHGDFTVSENGSYVTERLQTGTVSALSATSITVKSADDYTQTYTMDSTTEKPGNLATGSTATVIAKVSGDTATALSITEPGKPQQGGGQLRPGGGPAGGPDGPGGMPGQGTQLFARQLTRNQVPAVANRELAYLIRELARPSRGHARFPACPRFRRTSSGFRRTSSGLGTWFTLRSAVVPG